jgi:hypothetical protein
MRVVINVPVHVHLIPRRGFDGANESVARSLAVARSDGHEVVAVILEPLWGPWHGIGARAAIGMVRRGEADAMISDGWLWDPHTGSGGVR